MDNRVKKLILIGGGLRGLAYTSAASMMPDKFEVVALAEPLPERREYLRQRLNIPEERAYTTWEPLLAQPKFADAALICTMDRDHCAPALAAIRRGYDLLLEKPAAAVPEDCVRIENEAKRCGTKVLVCHVLRYTKFFRALKTMIGDGMIGEIVSIQHREDVGNVHQSHSFVRGNWGNSDRSSVMILQKSCHDMDILVWLTGSRAKEISSFGNLSYFKSDNAPEGSGERCLQCRVADTCRFDVRKAYLPVRGGWPAEVICEDQSEEGLLKALETSPYGRCVYKCDNNVCDNQVTNILFENGVTATFHLSGLTDKMHRTIRIMCEDGEIFGDDCDNTITVTRYSSNALYEGGSRTINVESKEGFHGGGDYGLSMDFYNMISGKDAEGLSSIEKSVESHLMAYAAEQARVRDCVIRMETLRK
jgi:predicted dehydrogenase